MPRFMLRRSRLILCLGDTTSGRGKCCAGFSCRWHCPGAAPVSAPGKVALGAQPLLQGHSPRSRLWPCHRPSWGHTGDSELKTFEELNSKRCKSWELKLRVKFRFFQAGMEGFCCNPSRAPGLGIVLGVLALPAWQGNDSGSPSSAGGL